MPSNLFRMASVLGELHRLGYRLPLPFNKLKVIEWGAGPASGSSGVLAAQKYTPIFEPTSQDGQSSELLMDFALIEQDRSILKLGESWLNHYAGALKLQSFVRPFHRKVDWSTSLLPESAPKFHLWLSSFFLNEFLENPELLATRLTDHWKQKLEEEGLIVMVEPALKIQSRKLLKLRQELLKKLPSDFKILLPCLGHQNCGALQNETDWCHEEVSWWRPAYFKKIDSLAELDRKTLPFSYLVIARSHRTRQELLPALGAAQSLHRQVSPSHFEGKDQEFYLCHSEPKPGINSKRKTRFRSELELDRGSIYIDASLRGDEMASRIDQVKSVF
jgi:ribosomal protein RSM22 (predicted rRNA methylase)